MIKWFKERSKQEKWMLALIAVLLVGVVVRWGFIKKEAGDAIKSRIEHFKPHDRTDSLPEGHSDMPPVADSLPAVDSASWNVVRNNVDL